MAARISRRRVLAGGAAASLALAGGAAGVGAQGRRRVILDDASRLSATPVFSHWVASREPDAEIIAGLRREIAEARREKRPLAIGAARHSMGGQSLPRDGHAIRLDVARVEIDRAARLFRCHGGTRWHEVIERLDPAGFSPAVMQSNSDFGVAATFSVGAHGWPVPYGPFGATVRAIRLMLADGTVLACSRTENAELFAMAMGGYGLAGIILEVEAEMTENRYMVPRYELMAAEDFPRRFVGALRPGGATMLYGRLNVARDQFFREALLVAYRAAPTPAGGMPPIDRAGGLMSGILKNVYRAQTGWEGAKRFRWFAEHTLGPALGAGPGTRNNLMNEPVRNLVGGDPNRTDILHEYFVAPERFGDFLAVCREIIPRSTLEFLNVTLRFVQRDETSLLAYAKTDRIAAVMSFSQRLNGEDEAEMMRVTEALIDGIGAIGGSYYLPYRLHARRDQLFSIYPNAERFAALKRRYDPDLVFRNALWDTYFA